MGKMAVAVDGPAGSGKSTVAKVVAEKLKLEYIDSGAIYRGITKKILDSKLKIDDYRAINTLLSEIELELNRGNIFINGEDFTPFIRSEEVNENVSAVSANIDIRKKVNAFLNAYSRDRAVIMDGRDIGTVVFPRADFKFYLDATVEVRARRRFDEISYETTLEEIVESIERRDYNDKNKKVGALIKADDAVYIDTSDMKIDEVVETILTKIKNK